MDIMGKLGASILWILVSVLGALLGVFGMLFNWVVLVTVFQFATYFGNSEGLLVAWSVLRDLGNILLLFGFIFIGLQTILNIGHFSVGKALPRLLIFAILINFSLLVSSAIIDASNIFSAAFYTEAGSVNCGGTADSMERQEMVRQCTGDGIAGKIMAAAGLTNIFQHVSNLGQIWSADSGFGMLLTYSGLLLLIIVMMLVFIAASIMLVIRAITLMFLMVLSPLGFAATAIPQFEEYSKMWWNKLLSQAFFAPAFLLMLFAGLKIMEGASDTFNSNGASLVDAFAAGGTGAGGIFILFMLITGFVIGSLMVASKLGAMGASFATRQAGNVVMGGIGFVGRRSGGMAGMAAAGAIAKNRRAVSRVIGRNNTMALYGSMKKISESSFDPRGGKPGSMLKSATGLDFGKPGKNASHGIHGIEEAAEKKRVDFGNSLKLNSEQEQILRDIKAAIITQTQADKQALADLDAKQAGDRAPHKERIEEQRRVAEAATGARKQQEEERLGNMLREYEILRADQGEERKKLEQEQKTRMDDLKKKEDDAKNRAKLDYIEDLNKNQNRKEFYVPKLSIGSHVDHTAAEKIEKKLKQTDADKILERLDKMEEKGKKDDHGGGDHGGGGHAPAKH